DAQRLAARFVDALGVFPPEVARYQQTEESGKIVHIEVDGLAYKLCELFEQSSEILAGRDHADRAGKDVIENERGNGELGHEVPHAVPNHDVYAAAHEHAAALEVHGSNGEAEQHHRQDEPGRGGSDSLFGDSAGVKAG